MATQTRRMSPNETFAGYTELTTLICANCAVMFAIPSRMMEERRDDHKTFWCPNGHHNFYPQESEEERAKRLLKYTKDDLARERARRDQVEASLRATKGVVTKQRKKLEKVVAGVCPVDGCHRHFKDLRRHISTKHPDYTGQAQA